MSIVSLAEFGSFAEHFTPAKLRGVYKKAVIQALKVTTACTQAMLWCGCVYVRMYWLMCVQHMQGRQKLFITGQAKFNPEHYLIKCVGGW